MRRIGRPPRAGVAGAVRGLLNAAVPGWLLGPALAIDATVIEETVVTAPLLLLAASVVGSPAGIVATTFVAAVAALLIRGLSVAGTAAGEEASTWRRAPTRRRRWCSMDLCGNLEKTTRYRRRRVTRAQAQPSPVGNATLRS